MNLYIAKIERNNSVDSWTEDNYVVAKSYAAVEAEFPKAVEIKVVKKDVSIIGFEFEGVLMETEEHKWVKINTEGSNLPKEEAHLWINDKKYGLTPFYFRPELDHTFFIENTSHYKIANAPNPPEL
jgi:hypothetical protein